MVHRWFTEPGSPARAAADAAVNGRFAETLARAERGELDHWLETPEGALALILVLDQFSRHVRRGEPPQGGGRAEEISRMVMGRGWDSKLAPEGKVFAAMPLRHAGTEESISMALRKAKQWTVTCKGEGRGVVERFRKATERR